MFCPKCGTEVPDDSRFCKGCGSEIGIANAFSSGGGAAAAPALAKKRGDAARIAVLIGAVFALIVVVAVIFSLQKPPRTAAPTTSQQTLPQPRSAEITDGAFSVNAEGYYYVPFSVPAGATNLSVEGRFSATGGSGNDIIVYVLDEDGFVNWKNRHTAGTYFNSGKLTQGSINARLPRTGTYYLVFDNGFSVMSPKAVTAQATLHYTL